MSSLGDGQTDRPRPLGRKPLPDPGQKIFLGQWVEIAGQAADRGGGLLDGLGRWRRTPALAQDSGGQGQQFVAPLAGARLAGRDLAPLGVLEFVKRPAVRGRVRQVAASGADRAARFDAQGAGNAFGGRACWMDGAVPGPATPGAPDGPEKVAVGGVLAAGGAG